MKKLHFQPIVTTLLFLLGLIIAHCGNIWATLNEFVVVSVIIGFELIRKQLWALRRAMNLSLDDKELYRQFSEKEYPKGIV